MKDKRGHWTSLQKSSNGGKSIQYFCRVSSKNPCTIIVVDHTRFL